MIAPQEFCQTVSKEAYIRAQETAARQKGVLRYTFPMLLLAAALGVYGFNAVYIACNDPHSRSYFVTGILLVAVGLLVAGLWCFVFPAQVKKQATTQYEMHRFVYGTTTVSFTADEMTIKGACLTRRVEYAKTRVCVETEERFLLFTDDETVIILEKDSFTDKAETERFLRDVFARWYKRKR